MKRAQPRGLSRRRIRRLLAQIKPERSAAGRIEYLTRQFLGSPYIANPLIGSADNPEVFVISLDGFDCVTFVETVLALARAADTEEFVHQLRRLRYAGGLIEWRRRNHYMTEWIRNNARGGAIRRVRLRTRRVSKERLLNVVPGLPPVVSRFECVPKPDIRRFSDQLKSGDVIFFASTKPHLDVFHSGIIVRNADRLLLRHASRSKGAVVEQELDDFLNTNRMAGVIVVRPQEN